MPGGGINLLQVLAPSLITNKSDRQSSVAGTPFAEKKDRLKERKENNNQPPD